MADLGRLFHDISLAFCQSCHLRTLLARLGDALSSALPVIEVEAIYLDPSAKHAHIRAYAPGSGRSWTGQRSARFFERQQPIQSGWAEQVESARLASVPVLAQLELRVGGTGLLRISLSTEISGLDLSSEQRDMLVAVLSGEARRLGQLQGTASCSWRAHHKWTELETQLEIASTEIPVPVPAPAEEKKVEQAATPEENTEMPMPRRSPPHTEMRVQPLDAALTECISGALRATGGRIYGDAGAAELLGLKPSTLQSKMRKLGIDRAQFV